jgi:protein SCO1
MITRRMVLAGSLGGAAVTLLPQVLPRVHALPNRKQVFPNPTLINHEGKKVRFYDDLLRGKTVLINMMYVQCGGICPGMTANLLKVQRALGDQVGRSVFMYSITLQPEFDSPDALAKYAQMQHVRPGWQFLTGTRADIDVLRRKLGFYDPNPIIDQDKGQHTGMVCIGNDALDRWCATPALREPGQIAAAVRMMNRSIKIASNV